MATADMKDLGKRQHLVNDLGVVSFLVCPIREPGGALLGALFVSWDETNQSDAVVGLEETTRRTMLAADKIGLVYSLRPKLPPLVVPSDHQ